MNNVRRNYDIWLLVGAISLVVTLGYLYDRQRRKTEAEWVLEKHIAFYDIDFVTFISPTCIYAHHPDANGDDKIVAINSTEPYQCVYDVLEHDWAWVTTTKHKRKGETKMVTVVHLHRQQPGERPVFAPKQAAND